MTRGHRVLVGALAVATGVACARREETTPTELARATSSGRAGGASAAAGASANAGASAGASASAGATSGGVGVWRSARGYDFSRVHSPIDARGVEALRTFAARDPSLRNDVFAKIGDSITASGDTLFCFARPRQQLGAHGALLPLVERFRAGDARGSDPFLRLSLCAVVGWSAWQALDGARPPLLRELDATKARFALVQYGTNDIEIKAPFQFVDQIWDIAETMLERGVIPILFTIPDRADSTIAGEAVPRYNAAIRGVALATDSLLADYHTALQKLPGRGLAGDGIHPNTFRGAQGNDGCDLGEAALRHGYNQRNLLALQALDRASRALQGEALDAGAPAPIGDGSAAAPWLQRLPFTVAFPLSDAPGGAVLRASCDRASDTAGEERSLSFDLDRRRTLQLVAYDRHIQTDLALYRDGRCLAAGERAITQTLDAGTYTLVIDARAAKPGAAKLGAVVVAGW